MQKQSLAEPFVGKLSFLPKEPVNVKTKWIAHRASQQATLLNPNDPLKMLGYMNPLSEWGNGFSLLSE